MADKTPNETPSPDDEALQKRVDAIMTGKKAAAAAPSAPTPNVSDKPATAPELPGGVYKPKSPKQPPITIKLADAKPSDPPAEEEAVPAGVPVPDADELDDDKTGQAVDDIAAKESDLVLAVEDARAERRAQAATNKPGWKARLRGLLRNKWTWIGVAGLLLVILVLPFSRYPIMGLFIKKPVTISVLDSRTNTPVSSAMVSLGSASAKTDAEGRAHLKAALGKQTVKITKQYYQSYSGTYFVGFKSAPQVNQKLVATGRLVPVKVVNAITGKPLSGVAINVKGTAAKTDSQGQAVIALPTTATTYAATVSLNGYNQLASKVQVTDQSVKANDFVLSPAGHIYFLSNLSGTIDVVKANLDGSGRKVVLSGTGHEDASTTSLLASRDWRYLVLKARRAGSLASLYLIDTSNDKVTEFDNTNSEFNLVGWYGHNFIYDLTHTSQSNWQTGREVIKSYDADNQQLNQLDQNQAEGSATSYAFQGFNNFYLVNGYVVYSTDWTTYDASGTAYNTAGKSDTIRAVQPNGQGKKDYQNFAVDTTGYISAQLYSPQSIYFSVYNATNGSTSYYDYENQAVKTASIDNGTFSASYPTFLISPSSNQTFWTELRDGQNTLFVGDSSASSKKQITSNGSYAPYGWYSDSYLLVSKNSSQLYIMPASGLSNGQAPLKITDYYKPAQTYNGYGYGYGGL